MINLRVAEVLAHEINGTAWEAACLAKGLDPSAATADQVIGKMRGDLWDAEGKRVLSYDHEAYQGALDGLEQAHADAPQDPRAFVAEVTAIAGLTKTEKRVVSAIVDGSPIPDGKQYTEPLAKRLNSTAGAVQRAWSRAKQKLRDNWVAE